MLEDLFKVVTTRFNGNEKSEKTSAEESNKIPDDLLYKCPRCRNVVFEDEIKAVNMVCPKCGYHGRLSAAERIAITVDKDSFHELDADIKARILLIFRDMRKSRRYSGKKPVLMMQL